MCSKMLRWPGRSGMPYSVAVDKGSVTEPECDPHALERAACVALERMNQPDGSSLAITFVDDATIRRLNEQYRGIDSPTDVLSFSTREGHGFILPEEEQRELGDVVISCETAARQARLMGHACAEELALLTIHGCLHLMGMDHDTDAAQQAMWQLQDELLAKLGYTLRSYSPPDVSGDGGEDD